MYIHHCPRLELFIYPLEYTNYRISKQIFTHRHVSTRNSLTRISFPIEIDENGKQVSFQINPIEDLLQLARAALESSHRREYKFPSKQAAAKKEGARRAVSIRNPSPWREITRPPSISPPAVSIREKGGLQFSCHPRHEEKHFPEKLERRWGEIGGDGVR